MSFSFGEKFRITIAGESHGNCIAAIAEGCPPGLEIPKDFIQKELDRRKPGCSAIATKRKEEDRLEILSGVFNGRSTGAPILMLIRNEDVKSEAYENMKNVPRPGHADFTASVKYEGFNDYRGSGTFSGRMTAALVMGGAVAKLILLKNGISVTSHAAQIGKVKSKNGLIGEKMEKEISGAARDGDSVGGIVECRILGTPAGIGEPFFDSIESIISHAVFSIPGIKGVEFGSGFGCAEMRGSQHNDALVIKGGKIAAATNNAGGVLGGISNGMPIVFRVAVKPVSSIKKAQKSIDLKEMKACNLSIEGRHDPCIVPRAVPVVECTAAICMADLLLRAGYGKK